MDDGWVLGGSARALGSTRGLMKSSKSNHSIWLVVAGSFGQFYKSDLLSAASMKPPLRIWCSRFGETTPFCACACGRSYLWHFLPSLSSKHVDCVLSRLPPQTGTVDQVQGGRRVIHCPPRLIRRLRISCLCCLDPATPPDPSDPLESEIVAT